MRAGGAPGDADEDLADETAVDEGVEEVTGGVKEEDEGGEDEEGGGGGFVVGKCAFCRWGRGHGLLILWTRELTVERRVSTYVVYSSVSSRS